MLEDTARVFRDENGDHLSEPEEVVLSSALTNKKEALPSNVGTLDRMYGLSERVSFQDQVDRNRIRRDMILRSQAWVGEDVLSDSTPSGLESPLDGTSSPGVAGTSKDGTTLTATGIRRAVGTLYQKNDLPVHSGNPIQFFSLPVPRPGDNLRLTNIQTPEGNSPEPGTVSPFQNPIGYTVRYLGVDSPDPKNDPKLYKESNTLGKIKGWINKIRAVQDKKSQNKNLLKDLLRIKDELEASGEIKSSPKWTT